MRESADDTPRATGALEVELWVRRPVCGPRTTVIDRLSSLRSDGTLSDFSVTTWPDEVVLTGRNRQSDLLSTIETFETWAGKRGLTLRPPFQTRRASLLVGGSTEVLKTPMLLAAVYHGEEVVGVYPCNDGDVTWTVSDLLDALERGGTGPATTLDETTVRPGSQRHST